MDKMIPIETGFNIRQDGCDLIGVMGSDRSLSLTFRGNQTIRVQFEDVLAYRVVDEVIESIDGEGVRDGASRERFAYEVKDGRFLASYPNVDFYIPRKIGPLKQYAFISTGWCVEVLSHTPPVFQVSE